MLLLIQLRTLLPGHPAAGSFCQDQSGFFSKASLLPGSASTLCSKVLYFSVCRLCICPGWILLDRPDSSFTQAVRVNASELTGLPWSASTDPHNLGIFANFMRVQSSTSLIYLRNLKSRNTASRLPERLSYQQLRWNKRTLQFPKQKGKTNTTST